jgi:tRNA uridine 5-carboxymethylaminomethyl modification enzyme
MNADNGVISSSYDVIVIGAGHAGCEAALAAARVGAHVLLLTPNLDRIGFMPCNPSIGGPAKGHIVAEIDALGGEMARAIDRTAIQIRTLNASKGPAVQALRAQADKVLYSLAMKEALENQPGLDIRQEAAKQILVESFGPLPRVRAVETDFGNHYRCRVAVVTAGTFLRGNMIAGEWRSAGGRAGDGATLSLAMSIGDVGIRLRRLKTGTPPRIDARSIDFALTEPQEGSETPLWFSMDGRLGTLERLELAPLALYPNQTNTWRPQLPCYLVHTGEDAHQVIRDNASRSPMYNGTIQGTGPRYCPSIEDKVVRFPDKTSHGLFLEPEGWRTTEVYVQGANTSLPPDVQEAVLRTIPALRDVRITRYGYAVEYDAIEPTELTPWFAAKRVDGLFLAGQVNGTSGYEEAAGQGLMAGLNAARYAGDQEPLVVGRDQGYIGVMADDLTTQEFVEPYRMLTSRAEHRLLLRSDNADERLAEFAFDAGLIGLNRFDLVQERRQRTRDIRELLQATMLNQNDRTATALRRAGLPLVSRGQSALDYLRRPDVTLSSLLQALGELSEASQALTQYDETVLSSLEIDIKYAAYVDKERDHIERLRQMEHVRIDPAFSFHELAGLRTEARERLTAVRPVTLGQASRIAGVTPSDLAVLAIYLRRLPSHDVSTAAAHA